MKLQADPVESKLQEVVNQIQFSEHLTPAEKVRFVESLYEEEEEEEEEGEQVEAVKEVFHLIGSSHAQGVEGNYG